MLNGYFLILFVISLLSRAYIHVPGQDFFFFFFSCLPSTFTSTKLLAHHPNRRENNYNCKMIRKDYSLRERRNYDHSSKWCIVKLSESIVLVL